MKGIITSAFLLFALFNQAQTWSSKLENAMFQNRVNNFEVYSREVKIIQGELFSISDFNSLSMKFLQKEGVFKLSLSQDRSRITVYYLEWIDQVTINRIFIEANFEFSNRLRIHQKMNYSFI